MRHGSHLAGYWEFPGGKQEPDGSLEECLEREIKDLKISPSIHSRPPTTLFFPT
jgi:hypothetical protein